MPLYIKQQFMVIQCFTEESSLRKNPLHSSKDQRKKKKNSYLIWESRFNYWMHITRINYMKGCNIYASYCHLWQSLIIDKNKSCIKSLWLAYYAPYTYQMLSITEFFDKVRVLAENTFKEWRNNIHLKKPETLQFYNTELNGSHVSTTYTVGVIPVWQHLIIYFGEGWLTLCYISISLY